MDDSKEFQLQFLQLQRSALIDTQTLFQLMIEKGICTVDEITQTRESVEINNPDVERISKEIAELQGVSYTKPKLIPKVSPELLSQLKELIANLNQSTLE